MSDRLTDEQHVWDCRWATLGNDHTWLLQQPRKEIPWVCERQPGRPRPVNDETCGDCPCWERDPLVH